MPKRYHCVFRNCFCTNFRLHCNNLCFYCNHANIWHSRKEKPPSEDQLAFISTRKAAWRPEYERVFISIEIPIAEEIVYCTDIDILPV